MISRILTHRTYTRQRALDEGHFGMAESFEEYDFLLPRTYPAVTNKSETNLLPIAGISILYFSPKSEDLRLQIRNVPLWNQLQQPDFTTWTLPPRIRLSDLTHGFDFYHGLTRTWRPNGRKLRRIWFPFLTLQKRINQLLLIAGISILYFSPKSEDLRLQIRNVPLWNIWHMDLLMKAKWPKASTIWFPFLTLQKRTLFITHRRISILYSSPKSEDLRLQIRNVPLWNIPVTTTGLYYMDFTSSNSTLGFDTWFWLLPRT